MSEARTELESGQVKLGRVLPPALDSFKELTDTDLPNQSTMRRS